MPGVTIGVGRTIAVGDVHGCLDELEELLAKLALTADDHLVLLGDLNDRGPKPVETIRYVRDLMTRMRVTSLLGNHEDKMALWRLREAQRVATGRPNNMRPPYNARKTEWEALIEEELTWIRALPDRLELPDNWVAVHAGLIPGVPLERQEQEKIIRLRTLFPDTLKIGQRTDEEAPLEDPVGTVFWTSLWRGPHSVVYGHSVNKGKEHGPPVCLEQPRVDRMWSADKEMIACVGIDTGCCYGGRLTAAVLGRNGSVELTRSSKRRKKQDEAGFLL